MAMDRATGIFVDGIGTAAATSGVLSPLGGRIFGLLYLHERPLALDEIATALEQSKSNISVNIRGLVEWHLVRGTRLAASLHDTARGIGLGAAGESTGDLHAPGLGAGAAPG